MKTKHDPTKLSRRMFLVGAGGASLSIPFLVSLAPRRAWGASATPKRFIAIRTPQGPVPDAWFPSSDLPMEQIAPSVRTYDLMKLNPVSKVFGDAFNPFRKKMLLLRRLDPLVSQQGHSFSLVLSGSMETGKEEPPTWETIDQVIARKVYAEEPVKRFINLKTRKTGGNISHVRQGNSLVPAGSIRDASVLFDTLFGSLQPETSDDGAADVAKKAAELDALAVDRVIENYKSIRKGPRISKADKESLDAHMQHLFQLQSSLRAAQRRQGCARPTNIAKVPATNVLQTTFIRSLMDIMFAAIKCDLTRVFTFHMREGNISLLSGVTTTHHSLAHAPEESARKEIEIIDQHYAKHVAYFLDLLDGETDPTNGKTYLDNSVVYYGKEMASSPGHHNFSQPVLLAGSCNDYFKTGQFVDYRTDTPRRLYSQYVGRAYNDFLITLMMAMGLSYGDWERQGIRGYGEYSDTLGKKKFPLTDIARGDGRSPLPAIVRA